MWVPSDSVADGLSGLAGVADVEFYVPSFFPSPAGGAVLSEMRRPRVVQALTAGVDWIRPPARRARRDGPRTAAAGPRSVVAAWDVHHTARGRVHPGLAATGCPVGPRGGRGVPAGRAAPERDQRCLLGAAILVDKQRAARSRTTGW